MEAPEWGKEIMETKVFFPTKDEDGRVYMTFWEEWKERVSLFPSFVLPGVGERRGSLSLSLNKGTTTRSETLKF